MLKDEARDVATFFHSETGNNPPPYNLLSLMRPVSLGDRYYLSDDDRSYRDTGIIQRYCYLWVTGIISLMMTDTEILVSMCDGYLCYDTVVSV